MHFSLPEFIRGGALLVAGVALLLSLTSGRLVAGQLKLTPPARRGFYLGLGVTSGIGAVLSVAVTRL